VRQISYIHPFGQNCFLPTTSKIYRFLMTLRFQLGQMNAGHASGFRAAWQKSIQLIAGCGAMRVKGSFRTAIALAVLVAVATVLIAPSIDMPETTLREHHVTSHSASNNSSGNLTSLGTASLLRVFQTIDAHRPSDGLQFSSWGHNQSSLVLRC
jgi:hypothetical protein